MPRLQRGGGAAPRGRLRQPELERLAAWCMAATVDHPAASLLRPAGTAYEMQACQRTRRAAACAPAASRRGRPQGAGVAVQALRPPGQRRLPECWLTGGRTGLHAASCHVLRLRGPGGSPSLTGGRPAASCCLSAGRQLRAGRQRVP